MTQNLAAATSPAAAAAPRVAASGPGPAEVRQRVRRWVINAVTELPQHTHRAQPAAAQQPATASELPSFRPAETATAAAQPAAAQDSLPPNTDGKQAATQIQAPSTARGPRTFLVRRRREPGQAPPATPPKHARRALFGSGGSRCARQLLLLARRQR